MKSEIDSKAKNTYALPNVGDYIKNSNLLNSINGCQSNAFISLTNKSVVNIISFEDYPNYLVYGIQKSGKSNFIENIIVNILLKSSPIDSKLMIIDTKRLEYAVFNEIPHLLCPIISDYKKAFIALDKIIIEIQRRYDVLLENRFKTIQKYNSIVNMSDAQKMPKLFIILDDLIDLVEYSKSEIVDKISLIIQKGRQVGVYIIVATSNVSRDIIDISFINLFSNRICFKAYSERDSKLLLNKSGAEKLDEYEYYLNSSLNIYDGKYQSYKIDDNVVIDLIHFVSNQQVNKPDSHTNNESNDFERKNKEEYDDPLYNEIIDFAISTGKVSASLLQRRFRLGYNRAARIVDLLEERGIIGPANGSKPREVLIKLDNELLFEDNNDLDVGKIDTNINADKTDNNSFVARIALIIVIIIMALSVIKYFLS